MRENEKRMRLSERKENQRERERERERESVLWPSRQQHGLLGSICCSNVERPSERELKRAKQKVDSFALKMRKKHFSAEMRR